MFSILWSSLLSGVMHDPKLETLAHKWSDISIF